MILNAAHLAFVAVHSGIVYLTSHFRNPSLVALYHEPAFVNLLWHSPYSTCPYQSSSMAGRSTGKTVLLDCTVHDEGVPQHPTSAICVNKLLDACALFVARASREYLLSVCRFVVFLVDCDSPCDLVRIWLVRGTAIGAMVKCMGSLK